MDASAFDVITMGRASVDLYCQQVGTSLERADTFKKAVGGCPSNIALGCARLGLQVGIITAVGAEQFGTFIKQELKRAGVSMQGVRTDPDRLSALAILSIRDKERFPLIFYRENCADMSLTEADVDPAFVGSAKAVLVTGTHFSEPGVAAAQIKAVQAAKAANRKVIFDIDYRPNLWGLAGHSQGESRFVGSPKVSEHLGRIVSSCDVIVGTEEEIMIAGGVDNVLQALNNIRTNSTALIVLKRGALGSVGFEGEIPDDLDDGIKGVTFKIDVLNVLGAGDAFMSGFLRGYLRDLPLSEALTLGNASGAMVVTRLMCSSEIPNFEELTEFIRQNERGPELVNNTYISQMHWVSKRPRQPSELLAFAIDHRTQMRDLAGSRPDLIPAFKRLAVQATKQVAGGGDGFGMLVDDTFGQDLFPDIDEAALWLARPIEEPGSRPLRFERGGDLGSRLIAWPQNHVVKCLAFIHPDDPEELTQEQLRTLAVAFDACRRVERVFMLEVIAGKNAPLDENTVSHVIRRIYDHGIYPDWWKLEPQPNASAWHNSSSVIQQRDPRCAGIVLLGLDKPADKLCADLTLAAEQPLCKGFAIGRTLFSAAAAKYFSGELSDEQAIAEMARNFNSFVDLWKASRHRQTK